MTNVTLSDDLNSVTLEDALAYAADLERQLDAVEETNAALRRSIAAYKANATRRRARTVTTETTVNA